MREKSDDKALHRLHGNKTAAKIALMSHLITIETNYNFESFTKSFFSFMISKIIFREISTKDLNLFEGLKSIA